MDINYERRKRGVSEANGCETTHTAHLSFFTLEFLDREQTKLITSISICRTKTQKSL